MDNFTSFNMEEVILDEEFDEEITSFDVLDLPLDHDESSQQFDF